LDALQMRHRLYGVEGVENLYQMKTMWAPESHDHGGLVRETQQGRYVWGEHQCGRESQIV
jgi:hypothetical protein